MVPVKLIWFCTSNYEKLLMSSTSLLTISKLLKYFWCHLFRLSSEMKAIKSKLIEIWTPNFATQPEQTNLKRFCIGFHLLQTLKNSLRFSLPPAFSLDFILNKGISLKTVQAEFELVHVRANEDFKEVAINTIRPKKWETIYSSRNFLESFSRIYIFWIF